ncbi:MAG: hypothetical protein ACYCPT_07635 [Acidimicrobiales bacterium]
MRLGENLTALVEHRMSVRINDPLVHGVHVIARVTLNTAVYRWSSVSFSPRIGLVTTWRASNEMETSWLSGNQRNPEVLSPVAPALWTRDQ